MAKAQSTTSEFIEIKTTSGGLRGSRSGGLATFKGIPYAGSISGENRFKAAPPLKPWSDVRDALQFGAPSPQPGRQRRIGARPGGRLPLPERLDPCSRRTKTARHVLQPRRRIHHRHPEALRYQDGGTLARTWDVVVVATNHRLGLMGFLYLGDLAGEEYATSGNQGLLDICDGLKWVHQNIGPLAAILTT